MTTTRIIRASEVTIGDRITEIDTPEGPFYSVTKTNPGSLVIRADDITLRLRIRPDDAVRVLHISLEEK